jgi:hypothetical protein
MTKNFAAVLIVACAAACSPTHAQYITTQTTFRLPLLKLADSNQQEISLRFTLTRPPEHAVAVRGFGAGLSIDLNVESGSPPDNFVFWTLPNDDIAQNEWQRFDDAMVKNAENEGFVTRPLSYPVAGVTAPGAPEAVTIYGRIRMDSRLVASPFTYDVDTRVAVGASLDKEPDVMGFRSQWSEADKQLADAQVLTGEFLAEDGTWVPLLGFEHAPTGGWTPVADEDASPATP